MGDMISTIGRQYGSGGRECQTAPGIIKSRSRFTYHAGILVCGGYQQSFFLPIFKIN